MLFTMYFLHLPSQLLESIQPISVCLFALIKEIQWHYLVNVILKSEVHFEQRKSSNLNISGLFSANQLHANNDKWSQITCI